jgi:predicted NUDIX family NTP pyrophosphohydrolase
VPAKTSAGIMLYRVRDELEVLLVHPGGPFWARKDEGAWSIPKGEYDASDEEPLTAARREFEEELGQPAPTTSPVDLGSVRLSSGKNVLAWALAGDLDPALAVSNTFEMEWPPRSGRRQTFPEVDRAQWFTVAAARPKLNRGQLPLLDRLVASLGEG